MSIHDSIRQGGKRRPALRLVLILCAAASAAAASAAGAANFTGDGVQDAPKLAIRYSPEELTTDEGARKVYQRLVSAAERVCPGPLTGSRLVTGSVLRCRDQAVAGAVHMINNARLAALYSSAVKSRS